MSKEVTETYLKQFKQSLANIEKELEAFPDNDLLNIYKAAVICTIYDLEQELQQAE